MNPHAQRLSVAILGAVALAPLFAAIPASAAPAADACPATKICLYADKDFKNKILQVTATSTQKAETAMKSHANEASSVINNGSCQVWLRDHASSDKRKSYYPIVAEGQDENFAGPNHTVKFDDRADAYRVDCTTWQP